MGEGCIYSEYQRALITFHTYIGEKIKLVLQYLSSDHKKESLEARLNIKLIQQFLTSSTV